MTNNLVVVLLATLSCFLWGSAPAFIKLGYEYFHIDSEATMDILLFAGLRFALAGIFAALLYSVLQKRPVLPRRADWSGIAAQAMVQTILQYLFYYIGAAHTTGIKVSIMSGMTTCISVIISCMIFRQEKMTKAKMIGCLAGFAGITLVNLNGGIGEINLNMSFIGEGFLMFSAIATSMSSVLTRKFSQKIDPVVLSGYQFFLGGMVLIIISFIGGGRIALLNWKGLLVLGYLALLSSIASAVWALLLKYNPVSKVLVYFPLVPVFGVTLSALILGEGSILSVKTILSLVLVCFGIWLINFSKSNKLHS